MPRGLPMGFLRAQVIKNTRQRQSYKRATPDQIRRVQAAHVMRAQRYERRECKVRDRQAIPDYSVVTHPVLDYEIDDMLVKNTGIIYPRSAGASIGFGTCLGVPDEAPNSARPSENQTKSQFSSIAAMSRLLTRNQATQIFRSFSPVGGYPILQDSLAHLSNASSFLRGDRL
jgi:hypothetical protein